VSTYNLNFKGAVGGAMEFYALTHSASGKDGCLVPEAARPYFPCESWAVQIGWNGTAGSYTRNFGAEGNMLPVAQQNVANLLALCNGKEFCAGAENLIRPNPCASFQPSFGWIDQVTAL